MEDMLRLIRLELQEMNTTLKIIDDRLNRIEIEGRKVRNIAKENEECKSLPIELTIEKCNDARLQDLWQKAMELIKMELTEVSYNTWIKPIIPLKEEGKAIYLGVSSQFIQSILELRYQKLLQTTIHQVMGQKYELRFCLDRKGESNGKVKTNSVISTQEKPSINIEYTFNNLVVGEHNKLAYKSALEIAQAPCRYQKLLYIYGDVGLGKTHILQAIGNYMLDHELPIRVKYMSMDEFITGLIVSIKDGTQLEFTNKLLQTDVLLLDNFQYIEGKGITQEEIHRIISKLLEAKKHVVIGCTKAPKEIFLLNERLTSLFVVWGVHEISKPSEETKTEILVREAKKNSIILNDEIMGIITSSSENVRELLGGFNRIASFSRLTNGTISVEEAKALFQA